MRAGERLDLSCSATGHPRPTISWRAPAPVQDGYDGVLVVDRVNRHQAGLYICTADNGLAPPATAQIGEQYLRHVE